MGRPNGLDPKRAKAFNYTTVDAHFKLFHETVNVAGIPCRNLFNMDEIGIQQGGGRNGTREKFFFSSDDKSRYRLQSDDLELVTILETVCADGTAPIQPAFVFQGKLFCPEWAETEDDSEAEHCFTGSDAAGGIATTDSGWTNDEVCAQWFERIFIPQAKAHADPSHPIVLM
ncbi:hypothetical protein BDZ89DRAFT_963648, partial [Hymenopellis radicata]